MTSDKRGLPPAVWKTADPIELNVLTATEPKPFTDVQSY
jgi:hypothetical protein